MPYALKYCKAVMHQTSNLQKPLSRSVVTIDIGGVNN